MISDRIHRPEFTERDKNFVRNNLHTGLVALALAAAPVIASASAIVDTGTPVNPDQQWSLYGDPYSGSQSLAARFDLSQSTTLTDVEGFLAGFGGTYTLSIAADDGLDRASDTPGATLFSQQVEAGYSAGEWSGVHDVSWSLGAGAFWVVFSVQPDQGDNWYGFMPNNAPHPTTGAAFLDLPGSGWGRDDNLDIGVRIEGGAVPEPAAWTMMITGFGFAGAALRRRRRFAMA